MKKLSRVLLYILAGALFLFVILVVFFLLKYNSLEKKVISTRDALEKTENRIVLVSGRQANGSGLNLLPVPKKVTEGKGRFKMPGKLSFTVADSLEGNVRYWLDRIDGVRSVSTHAGGTVIFRFRPGIHRQGYKMEITPARIRVEYSSAEGLFYSIISLKVLNRNYEGNIPCITIEDWPDLEVRGLMFDISRNKIPTRETLFRLAETLADLKFNHLELYIEGFSFAYPSFTDLWAETETPVTGEDIKALDTLCRKNFIDLVPNQNMFGHMMSWLNTEQYADLAECPEGFRLFGLIDMKGTLDPSDPRSIELVTRMTDDLLPNFTSGYFNVNMDETFDLGKGKSKKLCEEKGVVNVYMDYALKVHDIVTSRGKKMMMWGDIVLRSPEALNRIPPDVTLLDWGYEAMYPFEKNAGNFRAAGVNFMVCPGTSSWSSLVGRSDNMKANISNAVDAGVKHGAKGMLLTDWGDMGHWQYLPVSYPGYCLGGALAWNNVGADNVPLETFLSSYMYRDKSGIMGQLAFNLGKYPAYEEKPGVSMTSTVMGFQLGIRDEVLVEEIWRKMQEGITVLMGDLSPELISGFMESYNKRHAYNFEGMYALIDSANILLEKTSPGGDDGLLVRSEYLNTLKLLKTAVDLQYYIQNRRLLSMEKQKELLEGMDKTLTGYIETNKILWLERNKPGGYETSTSSLYSLKKQIIARLKGLEKSSFGRTVDRFFGKIVTAIAVTYIRNS